MSGWNVTGTTLVSASSISCVMELVPRTAITIWLLAGSTAVYANVPNPRNVLEKVAVTFSVGDVRLQAPGVSLYAAADRRSSIFAVSSEYGVAPGAVAFD